MRTSGQCTHRALYLFAEWPINRLLGHATVGGQSRGQIVDALSIRERPAEAADRAIPEHWEGDLLSGAKNNYIATLVERHSRCAMLVKVPGKE